MRSVFLSLAFVLFSVFLFTTDSWAGTCTISSDVTKTQAELVTCAGGTLDNLIVDSNYTLTINEPITVISTVTINGTITHTAKDTDGVSITATTMTINSGGKIDVNGKGCAGGTTSYNNGEGVDTADSDADGDAKECIVSKFGYGDGGDGGGGAGHGGVGGRGTDNVAGAVYDSSLVPALLGAGGGGALGSAGGAGGGFITIALTGTLTVDGTISANGSAASNTGGGSAGGGGAGGSINIAVGTLAGSSTIAANGGDGGTTTVSWGAGGGGGGGRVYVSYTSASLTLSNITAGAGSRGTQGSGSNVAANGAKGTTFILDSDDDDVRVTSGLDFKSGGDYTRKSFTLDSGAVITCEAQTTLTISTTGDFTDNGSNWNCTTAMTTVNVSVTGTLAWNGTTWKFSNTTTMNLSATTWTTAGTNVYQVNKSGSVNDWNITNNLTLNNLTYTGGAAGGASDGGAITFDNPITVSLVSTTIASNLNWTGLSSLTIDASSSINASGLGCSGGTTTTYINGYGPNTTTGVCAITTSGYGDGADGGGGGGHGGAGGRGADNVAGATYGSSTAPILVGSGGGRGFKIDAPYGGGKIRIDVTGTLTNNGTIAANSAATPASQGGGSNSGGGSGGSVFVTVGTMAGGGTVTANGGNGGSTTLSWGAGGGGGGGRISILYVTDSSTFLSGLTAASNAAKGSRGTQSSGTNNAADGSDGTVNTSLMNAPTAPTISAPTNGATGQSRALTVTTSAFSGNGSHTETSWQISDDNTFSDSDCSDANIVACNMTSTNKESIVVNSTNLTFQNALSGKTQLAGSTTYYVRARHKNAEGASSWASSVSFTTSANTAPSTPSNSAPADTATGQSKNPTLTASAYSDSDSDTHQDSDWALYEASDCSGTADYSSDASSNKTSIVVNSSNGTFADALSGRTTLKAHTIYSFKVRYRDSASGVSSYSTCTSFTTTNTAPVLDSSIADQTYTEDSTHTAAFDLDTYFSDVDFNDDDTYTCTASNGFSAGLGTMTTNSNRTVDFSLTANANGSDTIQFSCQDGGGLSTSSNVIAVTVTAVNDEPSFTKGANQTVLEDAGAQSVSTWATSLSTGPSDESGQTLSFSVTATDTSLFSAQPAVSSTGTLTYTPAANANGSTSVSVTVSDNGGTANSGDDTSASQTFSITITSVNDVPSFTKGANQTVLEDAGAQSVSGWATSISKGPSDESSQTVSFTLAATDTSLFSVQPAVSSAGILTYTPAANANGVTNVTVAIVDNGGTANSGDDTSDNQTFSVTITAINDTPTASAQSVTVKQDTAKAITLVGADVEGSTLTYSIVTQPTNGALSGLNSSSGAVTYTPTADYHGSDSFTFKVNDGTVDSSTATVSLTVTGVIITESNSSTSVTEGGSSGANTDTFTVTLDSQPAASVTVRLTVDAQANVSVTGQSTSTSGGYIDLSFDASNWSTVQTVTVTVVDDSVDEGNSQGQHSSTLGVSTISGGDTNYDSIVQSLAMTVVDNDSAGISVTASGGSVDVAEGSITDTYTIVLTTQPTADVTITITPNSQVTVSSPTLTFTSSNWNIAQTITVTAVNDSIAEGSHTGTITHASTSSDSFYNALTVGSITANITDNDTAGVTVSASDGATQVAMSGTTDSYTLVLTSQPTADVVIAMSGDGQVNGTPSSVTFTASNWNTAQMVTVSVVEGATTSSGTLTHAATSSDSNYSGLTIASITVTIVDDGADDTLEANAGTDQTVVAGKSVLLDGSGSTGSEITYSWVLTSGEGILTDATTENPLFAVPSGTAGGDTLMTLTITNAAGQTDTDAVTIHIMADSQVQTETLSTPLVGIIGGVAIYESRTNDDFIESISVGDTEIIFPESEEITEYTLAMTSDNYLVIGLPNAQDGNGHIFISNVPVEDLQDTVVLGESASVQMTTPAQTGHLAATLNQTASNASDDDFEEIQGSQSDEMLGEFLATGDINGDGVDEILIGSQAGNYGLVYIYDLDSTLVGVIFGSSDYPVSSIITGRYLDTDLSDIFFGPHNLALNENLRRQEALSNSETSDIAFLLAGSSSLVDSIDLAEIGVDGSIMDDVGMRYQAVALGDVNDDGQEDLVMTSDDGRAFIFFGPYENPDSLLTEDADVFIIGGSVGDGFGRMVAIGDVSGDGIGDVVIGAPDYGNNLTGAIYVVFGSQTWDDTVSVAASSNVILVLGESASDQIGSDLLLTDEDDDGIDEIYTVQGPSAVYRINLAASESADSGNGNSLGGRSNAFGCNLNSQGGKPRHLTGLLMMFILFFSSLLFRRFPYFLTSLLICLCFFSSPTFASTDRYSILYYRPAMADQDWIVTVGTDTLRRHQWRFATQLDYGYRPIELTSGGTRLQGIIDHLLIQHVGGAFAFSDRFEVDLDVPVVWYNKFGDPSVTSPTLENKMGMGDLMLRGRLNLLRRDEHILGFGLIPFMTAPTGNKNYFVGDTHLTGGMLLAVDANVSKFFFVGLNAGMEWREKVVFNNLQTGARALVSAGIGVRLTKALTLKADIFAAAPLGDLSSDEAETPSELFLATNYQLGKTGFSVNAGTGLSLIRSAGTPLYRGFIGLSYTRRKTLH